MPDMAQALSGAMAKPYFPRGIPHFCEICAAPVVGRHDSARTCSDACRLALRRRDWPQRYRRRQTILQRFYQQVSPEPNSGCWLWEGAIDRRGYPRMKGDASGAVSAAHVALLHIAHKPRTAAYCCHRCDNTFCVNPDHLYWGTPTQNAADMWQRGRARVTGGGKGEANPNARLTEADVLFIMRSRKPRRELAARFGISDSAIGLIRCGRNWSHITVPERERQRRARQC